MSSTWNKKSLNGIIPPTVQEQPEDEAQATAAGHEYQYPDAVEVENDYVQTADTMDENEPREGYGRPRSAPSSEQPGWFPREGHGRPLSAGGAARRFQAAMMNCNVLAIDDIESPHGRANPPLGDDFLHYPQTSSDGNSTVNLFDYNRYSRCRERDLEVEDYFTDSTSSASEEDEILYDATMEDPDRVQHLPGCLDISKEEDYRAELEKEGETLQEDAMNHKIDDTGRRGKENNVSKVAAHVLVKYKPRKISADFSSINRENQQNLYAKRTGNNVYPIKINEQTTSSHLHKPVRSVYTLENIKGDGVPINITTKQDNSELNTEQTAHSYGQVQNRTDSSEMLINGKQIQNKSNTVPAVLSKPFLTRVKLGPPNGTSVTKQDCRNQKTIVCETKSTIRALTLPNYKNKKTSDSVNCLANIGGSTIARRQIGPATIVNKNELNSNESDEILIPLSKVKDKNIQCMAVSRSLTQSLDVGKMKLRLVSSQVRKQHDAGRR